jgi:hypothetical protein
LQRLWDRGWTTDASPGAQARLRQAWARACERTDAATIIEAAKLWVAAADAPRYLPKLTDWLDGDGWNGSPPKKPRANKFGARRKCGGGRSDANAAALMATLARGENS